MMVAAKKQSAIKSGKIARTLDKYKDVCQQIGELIRTNDTEKLKYLIKRLPLNKEVLEILLSTCYEAIAFGNIYIPKETQQYVQHQLILLRLGAHIAIDNALTLPPRATQDAHKKEVIRYMIASIEQALKFNDNDSNGINEALLFIVRIIAKLAFTLQPIVKKVKWEQFVFYLNRFIIFHTNPDQVIDWLFVTLITTDRLKVWLEYIQQQLQLHIGKVKKSKLNERECDISGLLCDYENMRDVVTLKWMLTYLERRRWVDSSRATRFLAIIRKLVVLGEGMKNTSMTPKISEQVKTFLEKALSENVIRNLNEFRNNICHATSLPLTSNVSEHLLRSVQHELTGIEGCVKIIYIYKQVQLLSNLWKDDKMSDKRKFNEIEFPNLLLNTYWLYNIDVLQGDEVHSTHGSIRNNCRSTDIILQYKAIFLDILTDMKTYGFVDHNKYAHIMENDNKFQSILIIMTDRCNQLYRILARIPTDSIIRFTQKIIKDITLIQDESPDKVYDLNLKQLETLLRFVSLNKFMKDNEIYYAAETLVMIILQQLNGMKKISKNYHWIHESCPSLMFTPLRNQLGHKNTVISTLGVDERSVLFANARLLITQFKSARTPTPNIKKESTFHERFVEQYQLNDKARKQVSLQQQFWDKIRLGDIKQVKILLDNDNVDVNARHEQHGRGALLIAAEAGHFHVYEYIYQRIKSTGTILKDVVDINGNNALHVAAEEGNHELIWNILWNNKKSIDINSQNRNFRTALHIAVLNGYEEVVDILLRQYDINIEEYDYNNYKAIHYAIMTSNLLMVERFPIKHVLNSSTRYDNDSCLHLAIWHGHTEIINYLLDNGANVNICNREKETPLHFAAKTERIEILKLLVNRGGNLHQRDKNNNTVLNIAITNNHTEMIKYLEEYAPPLQRMRRIMFQDNGQQVSNDNVVVNEEKEQDGRGALLPTETGLVRAVVRFYEAMGTNKGALCTNKFGSSQKLYNKRVGTVQKKIKIFQFQEPPVSKQSPSPGAGSGNPLQHMRNGIRQTDKQRVSTADGNAPKQDRRRGALFNSDETGHGRVKAAVKFFENISTNKWGFSTNNFRDSPELNNKTERTFQSQEGPGSKLDEPEVSTLFVSTLNVKLNTRQHTNGHGRSVAVNAPEAGNVRSIIKFFERLGSSKG